jgi:hypothetical protein
VTKGEFKSQVADFINRQDEIPPASPRIELWMETARRQLMQKHDYKFMEASCRVPFYNKATGVEAPSDIKAIESFQVVDELNKLIFIPRYERSRAKFHQLARFDDTQVFRDDPTVTLISGFTPQILGYPLIVGWWNNRFWWFPEASGQAIGKYLYADYIKFLPFNIADRADDYIDGLLDEGVDALMYRVLIQASPWFRDQLQYQQLRELYADAENRFWRTDIAKSDAYGRPSSMEPDA